MDQVKFKKKATSGCWILVAIAAFIVIISIATTDTEKNEPVAEDFTPAFECAQRQIQEDIKVVVLKERSEGWANLIPGHEGEWTVTGKFDPLEADSPYSYTCRVEFIEGQACQSKCVYI